MATSWEFECLPKFARPLSAVAYPRNTTTCCTQVIIKCTGYERNESVSDLIEWDQVHANNVVRKNLAYLAEPVWDDLPSVGSSSTRTFVYGILSSYVDGTKFSVSSLLQDLVRTVICLHHRFVATNPNAAATFLTKDSPSSPQGDILPRGPQAGLADYGFAASSEYLVKNLETPEVFETLRSHILNRTILYLRRCLPEQFIRENVREWDELCDMCEARMDPGVKNWQRPQYPFMGLLDQFADEFLDEKNSVGGLESLRHDPIALDLEKWVRRARARNKVSCSEGAC